MCSSLILVLTMSGKSGVLMGKESAVSEMIQLCMVLFGPLTYIY